jgi:hypothetical protein
MSYVIMLRVPGAAGNFESMARDNADTLKGIADRGREAGAKHHAFYESNGDVVVIDEWDDPANFERFFESEQGNIGPLIEAAGATGAPDAPEVLRKLDSPDEF